jgi:hypothetical protein
MDMLVKQRFDELAAPRRNNYFYGKLLDEMHLRLEQDYFYGKRALLNRLALGAGVLCGLRVEPDGKFVKVSAGAAIDAFGREVIVPEDVRIDVSKISVRCDTVRDRKPDETTLYLKLCYRECKTDFEPALVSDCLPQQQCAPSIIVESYCLELDTVEPLPPPAHNEALCTALREGQTPEEKRDLVNAELAKTCGRVGGDGCIALATIHLDDGGNVTDAKFDPPQHVYSNAALFDMLLCLGEGTKGDPGAGLDKDLPKILDIGWNHNGTYRLHDIKEDNTGAAPVMVNVPGSFLSGFYDGNDFATKDVLEKRLLEGTAGGPLFTVYFNRKLTGIDTNTFIVRLRFEFMVPRSATVIARPGIYLELPIVGEVLTVTLPVGSAAVTPHTQEPYAFAATFIPRQEFVAGLMEAVTAIALVCSLIDRNENLAFVTMNVELKGDFVTTGELDQKLAEHAVLDADNIGGWVGSAHLRDPQFIGGGKNPSGNLTQGGDFESWLRVTYGRRTSGVENTTENAADARRMANLVRSEPESVPVNVNVATSGQLKAAGFSEAQATRILEARRTQWFAAGDDLQKRAHVSDRVVRDVANRIAFL